MVISTEPPGDTEAKRMRFHARWALGLLVAFAASIALLLRFDVLALDGHVVVGQPIATRYWRVYVKPKNSPGHWEPRFAVRVRAMSGDEPTTPSPSWQLEDDCSRAAYQCSHRGDCDLPFLVSSHVPGYAQIGARPVLTGPELMLGLVLSILSVIAYGTSAFTTRPWYLKRRVVDGGSGRL